MRQITLIVAAGLAASLLVPPLAAQRVQFGALVGYSLVGGGDSRAVVDDGGSTVTGAGRAGLHLRGFVDIPLSSSTFTFRAELFYNRLTSSPNSYAVVGRETAQQALTDRTAGLSGSFVAATSGSARVAPYFALGAGVFTTTLGYNPDPSATEVTRTQGGMGLGLLAGGGLRIRTQGPTVLVDWRYYQALHNTRGSAFMPLSIGMTF
ncbi:MAG: hypothetical protein ACREMJ_00660 [Gemmatimonadales bacterium]